MSVRPLDYRLRRDAIAVVLDRAHLCHEGFASELGLSRPYWSALFNGHRGLSPAVRARLIACPRLAGLAELDLWDVRHTVAIVGP